MQAIIDLYEKQIIRSTQIPNILKEQPKERSAAAASRQLDTYYKHYWENEGRELYITLCKLYGYSLAKVLKAVKEEAAKENEGQWPSQVEGSSDNSRTNPTPALESPIGTDKNC